MLPELSEIKMHRKQFNLTQADLARLANVSQSLIAKIEAGIVVPSYDNAKRIIDALEKLHEQNQTVAKDMMQKHVFFVRETDSMKKAVSLMEKYAVSQLPVLDASIRCVGTITEASILQKISKGESMVDVSKAQVKEIMGDAVPTIQLGAPFKVVQSILEHSSAVLVSEKGKIKGIITKADLLKAVLKKR